MMNDEIACMLDAWEPRARGGEAFEISMPLMHMTYNVITRALCNTDVRDELHELSRALTLILREGERILWALVPALHTLPGPRMMRLKAALKAFDRSILRLIDRRMNGEEAQGDLLDLLLAQTDPETGKPVGFQVLRDDLMTMLIAGHETTAMALAWSCMMMSRHPEVRDRVKAEVSEVLGGRAPTLQDLGRLQYTGWVIDEALRIYPPFWTISRKATQDDRLGPYTIPKGATLMMCPYVTHRNPHYWPNPEGFVPERFAAEQSAARPTYAYLPFGGGPRVCLGKNFALMEAKLYLALLAQRYELDLIPGQVLEPEPMISLRPRAGIHMAIRPAK
jgi:enediyne biosynthesis protein E7